MKKFTWKEWTVLAILLAFVIAEIVFIFVNPLVAICGIAGFIIGAGLTYLYMKNKNTVQ